MQLREIDHHSRQKGLTGALSGLAQGAGEAQRDAGGGLADLDCRAQPHHVVEYARNEAHRAGDSGADNILAFFGVAAVARRIKAVMP